MENIEIMEKNVVFCSFLNKSIDSLRYNNNYIIFYTLQIKNTTNSLIIIPIDKYGSEQKNWQKIPFMNPQTIYIFKDGEKIINTFYQEKYTPYQPFMVILPNESMLLRIICQNNVPEFLKKNRQIRVNWKADTIVYVVPYYNLSEDKKKYIKTSNTLNIKCIIDRYSEKVLDFVVN